MARLTAVSSDIRISSVECVAAATENSSTLLFTISLVKTMAMGTRFDTHGSMRSAMSDGPLSIVGLLDTGSEADQLREMLRDVIDPELGVDIVSLGLVYGLEVNSRVAAVLITTTTPACPLGSYISDGVERVLLDSGAVDRVEVTITHSPPWTAQMMSAATKRAFGWP